MDRITRFLPYGPHGSVGNNLGGWGDQIRALNAAGVPAFYKGADGYGPLVELMEVGDQFGIENIGVFRLSNKNGINFDVPNWYAGSPELAATEHVQLTLANLPPEFDKRVWLELINEPDKDEDPNFNGWGSEEFSDWLGSFAVECAKQLLPLGFKIAMFGFSSGEPEIPDWEADGMLEYLEMCAERPQNLAVALHEYSYNSGSLEDATNPFPWQLGRFTLLFDICDSYGIKRPTVLITEFGWTLNDLPSPEIAIPQLEQAARTVYGPFPEVLGVAIWHYGTGFNDIKNKAQRLLQPLADLALHWRMEIEGTPPPTNSDMTFEEQVWAVAENERILEFMPEAALQKVIYADGFVPFTNEYRHVIDGTVYAAQGGERLEFNEKRVYMAIEFDWGNVFYVPEEVPDLPPDPPNPPPTEPDPPIGGKIDLLPYFVPTAQFGPLYEVQDRPSGAQRRIQTQTHDGRFFIVKGTGGLNGKAEWEELKADANYIWRGLDTSPGLNRFYIQYENGMAMARWARRFMAVGETYYGPGHWVQFYDKTTCNPSTANSGNAQNETTLFKIHNQITFNGIVLNDVAELGKGSGERFWFARGIGMVGWKSGWNESYISELHPPGARPNSEMEPICNFSLI